MTHVRRLQNFYSMTNYHHTNHNQQNLSKWFDQKEMLENILFFKSSSSKQTQYFRFAEDKLTCDLGTSICSNTVGITCRRRCRRLSTGSRQSWRLDRRLITCSGQSWRLDRRLITCSGQSWRLLRRLSAGLQRWSLSGQRSRLNRRCVSFGCFWWGQGNRFRGWYIGCRWGFSFAGLLLKGSTKPLVHIFRALNLKLPTFISLQLQILLLHSGNLSKKCGRKMESRCGGCRG